jgi:hypothetical protein
MGQETPDMIVAKIFDPLHYFDCDDRVAEADREYAAEAAAYMHLHGQRHTKAYKPGFVPQYFGSWTTDITLSHLEKLFMSEAEKKATAKKEAQARAAFDAEVAASIKAADSPAEPAGVGPAGAETSDVPPQATELKVHDFRPVRLILLQYIKGTSLARQLTVKTIGNNSVTIKPKSDFLEERVRTEIFGKIMDSVVRIEHLGINTSTIKPSMFIITGNKEEESKKSKKKKNKGKEKATSNDGTYDVVMVDFTQVDVTHYTLMDYNIHQKLPLPMHPVSWGTPRRHWFSFRGWIPEVWFEDVKKYDEWGQAYFESDNYSTPKVVNDICESVGWLNDMIKYGNIRPRPEDDPEWQALMAKNNANMPEWGLPYRNEHGFKTKEEYDRHREQTAVAIRAARAEDKERIRKKRAALRDKIKAQEQAKEEAAAKKAAVKQLERKMQAVAIAGASAMILPTSEPPVSPRRHSRSINTARQSTQQVVRHFGPLQETAADERARHVRLVQRLVFSVLSGISFVHGRDSPQEVFIHIAQSDIAARRF